MPVIIAMIATFMSLSGSSFAFLVLKYAMSIAAIKAIAIIRP